MAEVDTVVEIAIVQNQAIGCDDISNRAVDGTRIPPGDLPMVRSSLRPTLSSVQALLPTDNMGAVHTWFPCKKALHLDAAINFRSQNAVTGEYCTHAHARTLH